MEITNNINKSIFRGYDIRGIYGKDLFENTAYTIGRAYATYLKRNFKENEVVVGYDNRVSSITLHSALVQGLTETGVHVIDLGLVTSPMLYFANEILNIHAGIMITASHNPKEYNGFKIAFNKKGEICGNEIVEFRDFVLSLDFDTTDLLGTVSKIDIRDRYIEMLTSRFGFSKRLKAVVDSGNGTASIIVKDIFSKLNMDVEYIFCDSNPEFPNHHPDPADEKNTEVLKQKVLEYNADIGISFDGDCDRVGVVDDTGRYIASDEYMAIISKYILPKLSNKKIIFDVSCSKTLSDEISKSGGIPVVYKTGNSYIKREMLNQGIEFGGEISGHMFFKDKFYGFDDGIYAALRLIEILDGEDTVLSNIVDTLTKYYSTPVIKIPVSDEKKSQVVEKVKNYTIEKGYNISTVDGVRVEFEDGFAIIRVSNTTPNLTLRFEATTKERLEEIKSEFENVLNKEL